MDSRGQCGGRSQTASARQSLLDHAASRPTRNEQQGMSDRSLVPDWKMMSMSEALDRVAIDPRMTGLEPLDFGSEFGNAHPVILEIGSGKGRFLLDTAREHGEWNFVGIEKSLHYHRVTARRLEKAGLTNARIINHDAFPVLQKMIPAESISEVHIYFPDPWPRPRERKRRMIREDVVRELDRVMKRGARGLFVTDHSEYFEKALPVLEEMFDVVHRMASDHPPRTNYEAKYREQGRKIFEAEFYRRSQDRRMSSNHSLTGA